MDATVIRTLHSKYKCELRLFLENMGNGKLLKKFYKCCGAKGEN